MLTHSLLYLPGLLQTKVLTLVNEDDKKKQKTVEEAVSADSSAQRCGLEQLLPLFVCVRACVYVATTRHSAKAGVCCVIQDEFAWRGSRNVPLHHSTLPPTCHLPISDLLRALAESQIMNAFIAVRMR